MFVAVSVVACTLAALQHWYLVPIRTGTMSHAICYAKDFEKLVRSRQGHKAGDFTMHAFSAATPAELFGDFSTRPQLWPEGQQMSEFPRYNYPTTRAEFSLWRPRPANRPIGGWQERWDVKDTSERRSDIDDFWVGGVFKESAIPPKRYTIDCVVRLTMMDMDNSWSAATTIAELVEQARLKQPLPTVIPSTRSRLRYTGPAHRDLLVFSRPINDELVQLVILDLRP
jgi:hypothetical protein